MDPIAPAAPSGPTDGLPAPGGPARGRPGPVPPFGSRGTEALSVLLTGRRDPKSPAVEAFLDHARRHELDLRGLYATFDRRGRTQRAVLVIPGVGRTAMLFSSPLSRRAEVAATGQLVSAALAGPVARDTALVQALVEPEEDLKHAAFVAGGMNPLTELLYLHRPADADAPGAHARTAPVLADTAAWPAAVRPRPASVSAVPAESQWADLRGVAWAPGLRDAFLSVIEASYEDTRDCPGLRGLRDMNDVLDGHRATGVFHPHLWTLWSDARGPVAALLMAESTATGAGAGAELVYLGVVPRGRGRGLGGQLLDYALASARFHGGAISLAVDRHNTAARRLYRRAGFTPTARRHALVFTPLPA